jgi:hypothetical protein
MYKYRSTSQPMERERQPKLLHFCHTTSPSLERPSGVDAVACHTHLFLAPESPTPAPCSGPLAVLARVAGSAGFVLVSLRGVEGAGAELGGRLGREARRRAWVALTSGGLAEWDDEGGGQVGGGGGGWGRMSNPVLHSLGDCGI